MSSKSAKKQAKAAKHARREAARRAERRRNLISLGIVLGVVVLGAGLIGLTLYQDRQAEADAAAELEAMQSEAASEAAAQAARMADRPVACGAEVPATAQAAEPAATPSGDATAAATEAAAGTAGRTPNAPPPAEEVLEEGVDYAAVIETSCGTLQVDLAEDRAPQTVAAFVDLARQGFYDGLEIFRNATSIGALQTGSGNNTAAYDAGFQLPDELGYAQEDGYPPGAVAMANSGPDTSSTQFFFVYNDAFDEAFADNRAYTRFGTVTEGLDVLADIGAIETMAPPEEQSQLSETPSEMVYMESVEIIEEGPGG